MMEEPDYSGNSADSVMAMVAGQGQDMSYKASKLSGLCVKWNRDDTLFDAPSFSPAQREYKSKIKKEKGAGMRSVASAPDFSRLNRLHDTQSTSRSSLNKSFHNSLKQVQNYSNSSSYFPLKPLHEMKIIQIVNAIPHNINSILLLCRVSCVVWCGVV